MVDPMKCFRDHFRVGNVLFTITVTLEAKREIGEPALSYQLSN